MPVKSFFWAGAALLLEGTVNGRLNVFGFMIQMPFDVEAWTIYEIFSIDAGTYLLAFIFISLIRFVPVVKRSGEIGSFTSRLKTGLRYLASHKYVAIFGVASYCVFVVILLEGFFVGPLYVSKQLMEGGDVYAASEMYYATGAVLAGFLTSVTLNSSMLFYQLIDWGVISFVFCLPVALLSYSFARRFAATGTWTPWLGYVIATWVSASLHLLGGPLRHC